MAQYLHESAARLPPSSLRRYRGLLKGRMPSRPLRLYQKMEKEWKAKKFQEAERRRNLLLCRRQMNE